MRLLALETSTLAGGVALIEDERTVGELLLDVRATHSERVMPAIDHLLAGAGWQARDLDALAVSIGPGSFTGLRIGVSVVKGLALGLGALVTAVPTLDALAAGLPFAALPVCPVVEARRGEVYCSLYRWRVGRMVREWDYLALGVEELPGRLTEPVVLTGPAATAILSCPLGQLAPAASRAPSAAVVGHLGLARVRAGQTVAAGELVPLYVRPSAAELRRAGGDRGLRSPDAAAGTLARP